MRRFIVGITIAFLAFGVFNGLASAADPVVTDLKVEAGDHLTVGDHFKYVVKVEADQGTTVFLSPGGLPEPLALARTPTSTTKSKGSGRIQVTLTLEVAAFQPGSLDIPPIKLRYRTAGGQNADLETQPSQVTIASVLPLDAPVEPYDLKAQADIGQPPAVWIFYAIGAALVALVVVVGLLIWRRRALNRRVEVVEPEPEEVPLGPEDRARAELDRAGREFAAARDLSAYYATIGVTARSYLTERFGFAAFALTTTELQEEMQRRGLDRWQARLVSGLLTQCDSAVYAGYRPAHERADADLTAAYEIVEMSRPLPPVVEVSAT